MKSLVVYINTMNASGGIERVVSNLLAEWVKNYSVTVLVKDDKKSYYPIPEGVQVVSINEPLILNMNNRASRIFSVAKNLFKMVNKLRRFVKENDFDYLYTVTPLNSLEFFLASREVMKKMVVSEHASAFAVNGIYQKIKRLVYPKAYCISVPNKMDCDVYRSWGCNTVYIPHPITFKADEKNKLTSKIAINVGRYTSDKRQDLLIRCWANVKNKNGWKLWIVGEGEEKKKLEQLIVDLNVEDSVILKPATKDIKSVYRQASLFLFSSRMEGFGMVLLEAMAFGIPCISFDCPSGPRDVIKNGYNGFLVENNNEDEFSSRVEQVINSDNLLEYGKNAYSTVANWMQKPIWESWETVFKK